MITGMLTRMRIPAMVLAAGLAGSLPALAPALAVAEPLSLKFNVDVGGMRAFKVYYEGSMDTGRYVASARIKPAGLASLFISRRMNMSVKGRLDRLQAHPRAFSMTTGKKKKTKTATVSWSGDRVATWKRNPPRGEARRKAIRQAIAGRRVVDPLSMLVEEGLKGPERFCTGTWRIFDGHTVYDLRLRRKGQGMDPATGVPVQRCRMTYVPVAGMSEKKKRKALASPPVFDVAFAQVQDRDVGIIRVPVSATGRLKGRPFHARLARGRLGGRPLEERIVRNR